MDNSNIQSVNDETQDINQSTFYDTDGKDLKDGIWNALHIKGTMI